MLLLLFIALMGTGLYAGGCLYSSSVVHPGRLICSDDEALAHFRGEHEYVEYSLPVVMLISLISTSAYWYTSGMTNAVILLAAVSLFLIIPYSAIVVGKTLNRLMDLNAKYQPNEVRTLLRGWGWLQLGRTGAGFLAFFIMLFEVWSKVG